MKLSDEREKKTHTALELNTHTHINTHLVLGHENMLGDIDEQLLFLKLLDQIVVLHGLQHLFREWCEADLCDNDGALDLVLLHARLDAARTATHANLTRQTEI